jgi:DNA polymerase
MNENTRLAYLEAMGIEVWKPRFEEAPVVGEETVAAAAPSPADSVSIAASSNGKTLAEELAHPLPEAEAPALPAVPPAPLQSAENGAAWAELRAQVAACTACPLHQSRTQTVFGVGDVASDWLVIGEAPGEQEDLQGEPFVGRAGLLLNEMLRAIGMPRERVYIANILKCRPPNNRDPQAGEAAACKQHLGRQIALLRPKIILAVGRVAAQNLLQTTAPIGKLRGVVHNYQNLPLVVVYHPAYLLRSPSEKRRAWDDLRLALKTYRQSL